MADEKKKKGGKFLKIIACLILVAIVVGLVIFFIPSDKTNLTLAMSEVAETKLLDGDRSDALYEFKLNVRGHSETKDYTHEIDAVSSLSESINKAMVMFNENIKYASSNRTYKNNNGTVKSNLKKMIDKTTSLNEVILKANENNGMESTYLRGTWLEYRKGLVEYLTYSYNAMDGLYKIYTKCYSDSISVNRALTTDMLAIKSYVKEIRDRFQALTESDKLHIDENNYAFDESGIVNKFSTFVGNKTSARNMEKYYLNSSVRTKYDSIYEYLQNHSFDTLIHEIDYQGSFESDDQESSIVRNYLGGN